MPGATLSLRRVAAGDAAGNLADHDDLDSTRCFQEAHGPLPHRHTAYFDHGLGLAEPLPAAGSYNHAPQRHGSTLPKSMRPMEVRIALATSISMVWTDQRTAALRRPPWCRRPGTRPPGPVRCLPARSPS